MNIRIIVLFLLMIPGISQAQSDQTTTSVKEVEQAIRKNGKYAILVKKAQHLKAAILTGNDFKARSEKIDFQIVVCGELVKELTTNEELKQLVNQASENGVRILACGLSIRQLSVDASLLPFSMSQTDNGLIYLFGLQEKGYKTITL